MLGDEGEQQEEYCYHGYEDASRDNRSVETGSHAKRRKSTHILLHLSQIEVALAVFVGLDMSKEEMRTTSPVD